MAAKLLLSYFSEELDHPIFKFMGGSDFNVLYSTYEKLRDELEHNIAEYYKLSKDDRKNYTKVCQLGFLPKVNMMDSKTLTNGTLVESIKYGHLNVVSWLLNKFSFDIYPTIDIACKYGHLDIAKWLYDNKKGGITYNALNFAHENGHTDVVAWLVENYDKLPF